MRFVYKTRHLLSSYTFKKQIETFYLYKRRLSKNLASEIVNMPILKLVFEFSNVHCIIH